MVRTPSGEHKRAVNHDGPKGNVVVIHTHDFSLNSGDSRLLSPISGTVAITVASCHRVAVVTDMLTRCQSGAKFPLMVRRIALVETLIADSVRVMLAAQTVLADVIIRLSTALATIGDRGMAGIIFSGVTAKITISCEIAQLQVPSKMARLLTERNPATGRDESVSCEITTHALFALLAVPTSHSVFPSD